MDVAHGSLCIKADRLQNAVYQTRKPERFSSDRKPSRLSFRLKELRTFACFPVSQQGGINYPPAAGWSPHSRPGCQFYRNQRFLNVMDLHPMTTIPCPHSRKEHRFANFPFDSFRILIFYKETFHFSPRNLRIEDVADSSRRLADL